jgi:rare lipoprotein A (peptidoglycan hydrolase)
VTFQANGVTVTVPVIDRGPYVNGRQWDMSAALCKALKHCYTGSITWRWGKWPAP